MARLCYASAVSTTGDSRSVDHHLLPFAAAPLHGPPWGWEVGMNLAVPISLELLWLIWIGEAKGGLMGVLPWQAGKGNAGGAVKESYSGGSSLPCSSGSSESDRPGPPRIRSSILFQRAIMIALCPCPACQIRRRGTSPPLRVGLQNADLSCCTTIAQALFSM
jgi:hypothetical protein